ncbi:MAG: glycosyltransferase [Prevotellaceae bacterium]|nr:glycosyltransferase [Prevotellaceae bacterium]
MLITVITATFNSAETLRDTFESMLGQSHKEVDYVVVDGASTDGTVDIIRKYEPRFSGRMRWVSERDEGIYDAMNKGISMAKGEVVGLLNSDDFYSSPDVLRTVAREFAEHPETDAVYADVTYVSSEDTSRTVRRYSSKVFRRWLMRLGFMPAHPSFYCRRSVYERFKLDGRNIKGFKGDPRHAYFNTTYKIAADFENLLRMVFVGRIKTRYIRANFVTMRTGGASSSGNSSHKQINADHRRAFRENGVYSNWLLISLRYLYKIGELAAAKLRR